MIYGRPSLSGHIEENWTLGYSHTKHSLSTQLPDKIQDHEDGIVLGDMRVFTFFRTPESGLTKPSLSRLLQYAATGMI